MQTELSRVHGNNVCCFVSKNLGRLNSKNALLGYGW